jgi:serine/threonine protein kinase
MPVLLLFFYFSFVFEKNSIERQQQTPLQTSKSMDELQQFKFSQLSVATSSFSAEAKIGEGSTGEVFKGVFNDVSVAVKLLKLPSNASRMCRTELKRSFIAELNILVNYRHNRIVQLVGWGEDDEVSSARPFALVFELLEGGSLSNWLLDSDGTKSPTWRGDLPVVARIDIALGAAAGLGFLHGLRETGDDTNGGATLQPALHRDIKSANIGIAKLHSSSQGSYSKILDCGLVKCTSGGASAAAAGGNVSFTSGVVTGTAGYVAPEVSNGNYTVASEIYSFGVVLLELLFGRSVGPCTACEVIECAAEEGPEALVARAEAGVWTSEAAKALVALILSCFERFPKKRPQSMGDVSLALHQVRKLALACDNGGGGNTIAALAQCCICLEDLQECAGVR